MHARKRRPSFSQTVCHVQCPPLIYTHPIILWICISMRLAKAFTTGRRGHPTVLLFSKSVFNVATPANGGTGDTYIASVHHSSRSRPTSALALNVGRNTFKAVRPHINGQCQPWPLAEVVWCMGCSCFRVEYRHSDDKLSKNSQFCSPRGKSLSPRTNLQVLVLVLGPQVLVFLPKSPWKLTLHSANRPSILCTITWNP